MSEGIKWVVELLDRTSGPARRVSAALDHVRVAQERVRSANARSTASPKVLGQLEQAMRGRRGGSAFQRTPARQFGAQQQTSSLFSSISSMSSMGMTAMGGVATAAAAVGAAAIAAAAAVGRMTFALGRSAAEAADWRNRTVGAFRVLGGAQARPEQAQEMFALGSRYAQRFGLDVREVQSQLVQLTAAGFNRTEALQVMQGAGDLGALEGGDAAGRAIAALRQIRSKGTLQMEELQQQLGDTGLDVGEVIQEIGRMRGLRGSTESINRQVRSLISAGRIGGREGGTATLRAIQNRSAGRLGATLDSQSRGVGPALTRISNAWLMLQSSFANSGAFKKIVAMLERFGQLLDPTSESGQRLAAQMNRLFDTILEPFNVSTKNSKDPIGDMFRAGLDVIDKVIDGVKSLIEWGRAAGEGFSAVFEPLRETLMPAIQRLFGLIGGPDGEGAVLLFRTLGNIVGWFAGVAMLPYTIMAFAVGNLLSILRFVGEMLESFWEALPDWFTSLFREDSSEVSSRPALDGVNQLVASGPGRTPLQPVVSQPNVTVNVNAQTQGPMSAEDIANAAGAVIPGIVQTSAERSTGRGAA